MAVHRNINKMKNYIALEAEAKVMLEKAIINSEQWETSIPAIDADSRIARDYSSYLLRMHDEFMEKKLTLKHGRYLFNQWGNYTAEPENVDYIESTINNIRCLWCVPHNCIEDRVILACHGGAYTYGSIYSHRKAYAHLAKKANCKAIIIDYSHTPEHPWPNPLDDVVSAYQWLLEHEFSNNHIAITGDSAGGALAIALALRCKTNNLPMPGALMPISPWGDLEGITPIYRTNTKDLLNEQTMVRLGGSILELTTELHNPELAPIYIDDFSGFPPMYIQVGSCENFADDARIISGKAYSNGVNVKCEFVEKMQHCFHQMAGYSKDADNAIQRFADWLNPIINL